MKKKAIIITIAVVVILLAAVLLVFLNDSFSPKKDPNNDVVYTDPEIKELKLKSIQTKDKKVKIDDTIAYFTPDNGISQVDLEIKCKEDQEEIYLLLEFVLKDKTDKKIVYQQDIEANEEFKYIVQSEEDLTETKSWKVSQVTEHEAIENGFVKVEE